MEKRWKDHKRIIAQGGALYVSGNVFWVLGLVFAVLGVMSDGMGINLGLGPASWLLLAIVCFVSILPTFLGWALAVYLDAGVVKSRKQE